MISQMVEFDQESDLINEVVAAGLTGTPKEPRTRIPFQLVVVVLFWFLPVLPVSINIRIPF